MSIILHVVKLYTFRRYFCFCRKTATIGTRIRLNSLCNDERDMPPGLCGTVVGVDDQPALLMKWDNGRGLSILPDQDSFTVIQQESVESCEKTINDRLYDKADNEQAQFLKTFLLRPPQEILNNAWEYVVRWDIIEALQNFDLDNEQAETLLQLPDTMDVLTKAVLDQSARHMGMVVDIIEEKADELRSEQTASQLEQTM